MVCACVRGLFYKDIIKPIQRGAAWKAQCLFFALPPAGFLSFQRCGRIARDWKSVSSLRFLGADSPMLATELASLRVRRFLPVDSLLSATISSDTASMTICTPPDTCTQPSSETARLMPPEHGEEPSSSHSLELLLSRVRPGMLPESVIEPCES